MANKSLNFNTAVRPSLEITLQDEKQTFLRVTVPTTAQIYQLKETMPALQEALKTENEDSISALYSLAAGLISRNREDISITVEYLQGECAWGFEELLLFFNAYLDFINDFKNAKN